MANKSGRWISKDSGSSGRIIRDAGISKRGGESYKVTKSPPPKAPAPAVKPNTK